MRGQRSDVLFSNGDIFGTLRNHLAGISARVSAVPEEQLLNASEDALVEHISAHFVIEPLEVFKDQMVMEREESTVQVSSRFRGQYSDRETVAVPGFRITVDLPFTGDAMLWKLKPSSYTLNPPCGRVVPSRGDAQGKLQFVIERPSDEPHDRVKGHLDAQVQLVEEYLRSQKTQVEAENAKVGPIVREAVKARRERLLQQRRLTDLLGIPLKRNPSAPDITTLPIRRKLVRPLPAPPSSAFAPEPGIRDEEYEHILAVVRHEGRTFETTPQTYASLGEEDLRNILLAHLNGHYEGDATGETFRGKGKTDIRIEDKERAAFVGECKVWHGVRPLGEAADQVLGYLTWRDCKLALILFNKTVKGFSDLLEKIPQSLRNHQNFRSETTLAAPGEWRFRFASADDAAREVVLHVFIFNLFHR